MYVHHSPDKRFVVKVVVANSVHSKDQMIDVSKNLNLPNDHWQIRVVGHEGIETSKTSRLAGEIFPLRIKLNLVGLEIHGNTDACPTTLGLYGSLAFDIKLS